MSTPSGLRKLVDTPDWSLAVLPVGPLQVNCYLLTGKREQAVLVVDPGAEVEAIQAAVPSGATITTILLTHGHYDHTAAVTELVERTGAKVICHRQEQAVLADAELNASAPVNPLNVPPFTLRADELVDEQEGLCFADLDIDVIWTPGHTSGSSCFVLPLPSQWVLLTGDTLFAGSRGRTDFAGGSAQQMRTSLAKLAERMAAMDQQVIVAPGHLVQSTVGEELAMNPFLSK